MQLLFDFDGTLVNSFRCVMEKTILLAEEFKFRKIQEHEIESLRDLSSRDIIKYLKIPMYKIPKLIHSMRKHLQEEMIKLPPFPDMNNTLKILRDSGFSMGIMTSNSIDNVLTWLEHHNMHDYFNFIQTEANYFSKKYLLKKILKARDFDKSQIVYICDETRDIDAATQNEVKSIAVTWGYNSEKALTSFKPTYIARQPEDILTICKPWNTSLIG